jgi:hypothetical protein
MVSQIAVAAVAYVAGAFTPSIGRKIKSLFVKDSKIVVADFKADASKAEADVKAKL